MVIVSGDVYFITFSFLSMGPGDLYINFGIIIHIILSMNIGVL